ACARINPGAACKISGNDGKAPTDCCSQLCTAGKCDVHASYCTQTGDVCGRDDECCGGICKKADGATVGLCSAPAGGNTRCAGAVDGLVCGTCNDCCSRECAPYK